MSNASGLARFIARHTGNIVSRGNRKRREPSKVEKITVTVKQEDLLSSNDDHQSQSVDDPASSSVCAPPKKVMKCECSEEVRLWREKCQHIEATYDKVQKELEETRGELVNAKEDLAKGRTVAAREQIAANEKLEAVQAALAARNEQLQKAAEDYAKLEKSFKHVCRETRVAELRAEHAEAHIETKGIAVPDLLKTNKILCEQVRELSAKLRALEEGAATATDASITQTAPDASITQTARDASITQTAPDPSATKDRDHLQKELEEMRRALASAMEGVDQVRQLTTEMASLRQKLLRAGASDDGRAVSSNGSQGIASGGVISATGPLCESTSGVASSFTPPSSPPNHDSHWRHPNPEQHDMMMGLLLGRAAPRVEGDVRAPASLVRELSRAVRNIVGKSIHKIRNDLGCPVLVCPNCVPVKKIKYAKGFLEHATSKRHVKQLNLRLYKSDVKYFLNKILEDKIITID